jgi:UDP-N-acetylmuramoyl-tripeptide--D-alanyl-D-alanine ligase
MTARDIAHRCGGTLTGDADAGVSSWAFDSRVLEPGSCFVALRGERDGNEFVRDAFRSGARVALVDRPAAAVPAGCATVQVPDTIDALQAVARAARAERSDVRVVGVTGSTGKTSTKDLLAAALASLPAYASPESYNNEFGLPITLLNAPPAVPVVVAEMGERFPGDIAKLCDIARPDVGVVTNVGLAHAEHLGGREGVAAVLAELPAALPATGLLVLDADDEWCAYLAAATSAAVVTVGTSTRADYRIADVHIDGVLTPSFSLAGQRLTVPLPGAHQIQNAALAAAVAHRGFDLSWDEIRDDLQTAVPARWRMEIAESPNGVIVLNDSYNANPASVEAALRALAHLHTHGTRLAVLGDMRELGAHADEAHEAVGTLAGALGIDVVIGVGTSGAQIADAAEGAGTVLRAADAAAARALVEAMVKPGDAVLVKASRALGLQVVAEALMNPERAA